MLRISPFTPLFFSPSTDRFGVKSKYVQKFATTDILFIEVLLDISDDIPSLIIYNLINNREVTATWSTWKMNDNKIVCFHIITGLECSYYNISIGNNMSEVFKVTDDSNELNETTLIQYSMKDNLQRIDSVWWIDSMQYFLDFRVPGGFKDDGWTFGVNNEQFVTFDEDIVELYSHEYTTKTFTLGNAIGCPVWFAEMLNRILCCNYVYFDGIRYARKESSVPELNQSIEGLKSYIFNQMLQKIKTIDPTLEESNQVNIRRVANDSYRNVWDGDIYKPLII